MFFLKFTQVPFHVSASPQLVTFCLEIASNIFSSELADEGHARDPPLPTQSSREELKSFSAVYAS